MFNDDLELNPNELGMVEYSKRVTGVVKSCETCKRVTYCEESMGREGWICAKCYEAKILGDNQ